MTLADIAGWLSLSWDTVRTVVQRRLEKDYRRIGYRKVRSIAIDELYLGRTHKYVTLVIDLESGRIIWVEQGRGSQALREFWRRFKLSGARLKAVAMDMSGAYAASVRAHAPHAMMTFDRFHVIKLMNERLDDLRRELPERPRITMPRRLSRDCAGCFYTGAITWRKTPPGAWNVASLLTSLCNAPICSRKSSENSGSKETDAKPGDSCVNGVPRQTSAASDNFRLWRRLSFAMPRGSLAITRPGSPVEKWRASTEKSADCSPAPSASATRISSNCVSTLSMKPNSNSSAKTRLSR